MEEGEKAEYEGLPKLEESSDEDEGRPELKSESEDEDGEIKKMRKELKFYDFTSFPRHFKNPHDCIDYYNDMCYQAEV